MQDPFGVYFFRIALWQPTVRNTIIVDDILHPI